MRRAMLFTVLFLFLGLGSGQARVWFVYPDGSGQAPTIQAGIDSCAAGDTVVAMPGIFTGEGNWDLDFMGKPIVVMAARFFNATITNETIIDAQATYDHRAFHFHSNEDSTSVVLGFVIQDMWPCGIQCDYSSPTILNNRIEGPAGGIDCFYSSAKIIGNILSDTGGRLPIYCTGGSPYIAYNNCGADNMSHDHSTSLVCTNCTLLTLLGNSLGGVAQISGCSGVITGNSINGYGGALWIDGSILSITNNLLSGHHGPAVWCSQSQVTIENNRIMPTYTRFGGMLIYGSLPSRLVGNDIGPIYGDDPYVSGINYDGDSTSVIENNIIHDIDFGCGIICQSSIRIAGNLIFSNLHYSYDGGGIYCEAFPTIENNTIIGNSSSRGAGIYCAPGSSPILRNNIIANNGSYNEDGGGGIYAESSSPTVECCDVYGNEGGNYVGIPDQTGLNGNISADPIFCDAANNDYSIHELSPCAPGNHPDGVDCGLIGARGIGCNYIATLLQAWAAKFAGGAVVMIWTLSEEQPLSSFTVWREDLATGSNNLVAEPQLTRQGPSYTLRDATVEPGLKYRYRVKLADGDDEITLFETEAIAIPTMPLALFQNYPNPFNPSTNLQYYLPAGGRVKIEVYDVAGKLVACILDAVQERGYNTAAWDGRDAAGETVSSGVYFYRLTAGKETISRKMVLMR